MPATDESAEKTYRLLAQVTILCHSHGVKRAVLSPGSRSAPLALSFMRNKSIEHFVISDERSAAYAALGMAKQSQSAVTIVCTSGTAALNYGPAIAEAFFSEVPLIIFTADRPPEWIGQADNQSIYQDNIYGKHVKASFTLPVDYRHPDAEWHALRLINEGLNIANSYPRGPVHFNVPLREPLYIENANIEVVEPENVFNFPLYKEASIFKSVTLCNELKSYNKVLIVTGTNPPDEILSGVLGKFCAAKNIPLLTDITSNLHRNKHAILNSDLLLDTINEAEKESLVPDLLISFGGPLVSKHLKEFLKRSEIRAHWHITPGITAPDTFQKLTKVINGTPAGFFNSILDVNSYDAEYYTNWENASSQIQERLNEGFSSLPYSESKATMQILQAIPKNSILHLGNSLPVRHATSFPLIENANEVYSNRGTSGIDGSLSTAGGHSMISKELHVLILGDMSFLYDSNGLWNNYLRGNFKIIVLNNHGGRIFESLPGAKVQTEINEYFVTDQPLTFEYTALQHNILYNYAENEEELLKKLNTFFLPAERPAMLEIRFKDCPSLGTIKSLIKG
jgi:2-succinyl-5-enolpyruvyl-6-hydroxy-3-cyclohexene-1-carboxylate synthase